MQRDSLMGTFLSVDIATILLLLGALIANSEVGFPLDSIVLDSPPSKGVYKVEDYGARGNGVDYDTGPIQAAIEACAGSGGGSVVFGPGRYLTGTLFLRSDVTLQVEAGATVVGSAEEAQYPGERLRWYVILAEGASNVGITGGGVIDGQGWAFVAAPNPRKNVMVSWNQTGACLGDECRPRLLGFRGCTNVHVWDINLHDPAYWCLHLSQSTNISIHDVSIQGDFNIPNNDGIDIEDSNNTHITRCHIDTGDDAICPKALTGPVYNVTVTHCWIRTKSSAIKLGSASYFNFHMLRFDNIKIVDSHRGLAIQLRDSGNVSDVVFSNIDISTRLYDPSWWGRAEPIYVTACPRNPSTIVGSISGIHFSNISAKSENGLFLAGSGGGTIRGLSFSNIRIKFKRRVNETGEFFDYRPGCQGLVKHRSSGAFMEHIDDLTMQNVTFVWALGSNISALPLDFNPSTIGRIELLSFESYILGGM